LPLLRGSLLTQDLYVGVECNLKRAWRTRRRWIDGVLWVESCQARRARRGVPAPRRRSGWGSGGTPPREPCPRESVRDCNPSGTRAPASRPRPKYQSPLIRTSSLGLTERLQQV